MKTIITSLLLITISFSSIKAQVENSSKKLTVTYIANEGFLIETKNHKILIDALFGRDDITYAHMPSDSLLDEMIKGTPPFDNIDLVLASHLHRDHCTPDIVVEFLINNRNTEFVSTEQAKDKISQNALFSNIQSRVHSFPFNPKKAQVYDQEGITVNIYPMDHSWYSLTDSAGNVYNKHGNIENFAFSIIMDGIKVFHSGDATSSDSLEYDAYNIVDMNLDLAFLDRGFIMKTGQRVINRFIRPKQIVFMHLHPDRIPAYSTFTKEYPPLFVFEEIMQSKTYNF